MRAIGFDTETIQGRPYTFQLSCGETRVFYENRSLSPKRLRTAFFNWLLRSSQDGDVLFSYNLAFEIAVLWRDELDILCKNRFAWRAPGVFVRGVAENPTPFFECWLSGKRTVRVVDACKYFGDGERTPLEKVAKAFLAKYRKLKHPTYLGERMPRKSEREYFIKYAMTDAIITEELGKIILQWHETLAELDPWKRGEICPSNRAVCRRRTLRG